MTTPARVSRVAACARHVVLARALARVSVARGLPGARVRGRARAVTRAGAAARTRGHGVTPVAGPAQLRNIILVPMKKYYNI